jgi:DNA-directed RNA polymerase specialized sigma24 family protein
MPAQRVQAATRPDDEQLFVRHARRLHAVVRATVRTSPANVEDACGFAWLQLVRHRPPAAAAFAWLRTTAVREAIKLQHRTARLIDLEGLAEVAPERRRSRSARLS